MRDRQQAAPEAGEIPHGTHRKGDPHKGKTGRRVSPRQRQGAGRIPNDAVKKGPHGDAGGRGEPQTHHQHQPAAVHGVGEALEQQQRPDNPPAPANQHVGQQGAPEAKPDTASGPVQPQPIGTGQRIEAEQHHQDLPHRGQNGAQQKLGIAGVEVIERSDLTADRHRLPECAGQRLAIGHRLQHADLTVKGAYHLRQRRVDQLGDQDELAVVEHRHLRLGALTGIPLQMVGDHHQRIDVATAQGVGTGIDGVKLLRHLEPGRAIQREGELAREHAVVEIHQPHLEVAGQPCREDPAEDPHQQQRHPAHQGTTERILPQQPKFTSHQSSTSTLMPTRSPSTGCSGRASTWKLFMSKP